MYSCTRGNGRDSFFRGKKESLSGYFLTWVGGSFLGRIEPDGRTASGPMNRTSCMPLTERITFPWNSLDHPFTVAPLRRASPQKSPVWSIQLALPSSTWLAVTRSTLPHSHRLGDVWVQILSPGRRGVLGVKKSLRQSLAALDTWVRIEFRSSELVFIRSPLRVGLLGCWVVGGIALEVTDETPFSGEVSRLSVTSSQEVRSGKPGSGPHTRRSALRRMRGLLPLWRKSRAYGVR